MKRLHLICNAHLDPMWMWDYDEGIAADLATFRSAVQLAKEYDYIFCHNESLLYEWIEEYDPKLFEEIRELVKEGKWHIMGGWYLQPDCQLPSGESFIRQILVGQSYFMEKFGARPTTAINMDSFGHSRGLVQILNKCGYDSYLFCRPMPTYKSLPDNQFLWKGYDGSTIKCCRIGDDMMYCNGEACAKHDIPLKAECWMENEAGVALWGVGNHGGGPSRIDLADIKKLIEDTKEYEILHSTPEQFFAEVHPDVVYDGNLMILVGCYTSMSSVKQRHAELENRLYATEKMCSVAMLNGNYEWNKDAFEKAQKALLFQQFHDTMGGTLTSEGEKSTLTVADSGINELINLRNRAFFALIEDEKQAKPGEYPIFVFNPSAYERETEVETEVLILGPIVSDTIQYKVTLKRDGQIVPCQVIKELSNINYDRRKRVAFKAKLPAMGIARFDLTVEVVSKEEKAIHTGDIVFEDSCKKLRISKSTGLLESYVVDGKEYIAGGAFCPVIYDDNADPWGWDFDAIGENPQKATLDECKDGMFAGLENVHVIEDGDILTEVEAFFKVADSKLRLSYKIYKELPYIDVHADIFWNETQKTLKIAVPTATEGEFACQSAYGTDIFPQDRFEYPCHRFISMREGDKAVSVFNRCVYGASAKEQTLYMTLMRGVAYCAHPIEKRQLIADDRYIPFMEQGKHEYDFRFAVHPVEITDNLALEFCETPYSLNAFPAGTGTKVPLNVELDNQAITLSAMYYENNGYTLRLFNNNDTAKKTKVRIKDVETTVELRAYEFKTVVFTEGKFIEKALCI